MTIRPLVLVVCLTALTALACGRQATPPSSVAVTPRAPTEPAASLACDIEAARTVKLDDGTELRIWDLKMNGLKQLTAKLHIATDGKVQTANEIEYKWETWGADAPAAAGQLVLLVQDGKAFGVKDKRIPQIGLEIQGAPSQSMTGKKSGLLLTGELQSRITTAMQKQSVGKRDLVYAHLFTTKDEATGSFSLGLNPDELANASKNGRTVLAVEVGWIGR